MPTATSGPGRPRVFVLLAALSAVVALVGFGKTFFAPLAAGRFHAPPAIYVHAAALFGWVGFFLAQAVLPRVRKMRLHRTLGWCGAALAVAVVGSTIAVAILASRRTAATGAVGQANAELFVIQLEMASFAALVAAALLTRSRPEVHKRLLLLALIASLGPAWFRLRHYFPGVENPLVVFSLVLADSLILVAAAADLVRRGRVHWVYPIVGGAMVSLHLVEVFAFDTAPFRAVADLVAGPLI